MRLTSKGQVTIPQSIRQQAGLQPGEEVDFHIENGRIWLDKVAPESHDEIVRKAIIRLRGSATANLGISTDEWMRMTRGED